MPNYLYNLVTGKNKGLKAFLINFFLFLLSLIYGLIIRLLIFISGFRAYKAPLKVISVGNITWGGTGKTPLVELIAGYLKERGSKVAVVTRGYKNADEPKMLAVNLKNVPVIVSADRKAGIQKALRDYAAEIVILDDGFQQWGIVKDLEIVTIDAANPFGNQRLIPRGILRQPLATLKKADIFVVTKVNLHPDYQDLKNRLSSLNPAAIILETVHQPKGFYILGKENEELPIDYFVKKRIALISGIAVPESFEALIKSLKIDPVWHFKFSDHHNYTSTDWEKIRETAKLKNIDTFITTEKDAVKLKKLPFTIYHLPFTVFRIELKITKNEEGFFARLSRLYNP